MGHELIHRKEQYHKFFGMLAYSKFFYSYFADEHVQGHHKYMATPEDPATAVKGESMWWFWVREPIMSNINVWKRDVRRIKKRYGDDVAFWKVLLHNKQTKLTALHLFMSWVIIHYLGWQSFRYQIIYNLWSSYML